MIRSIPYNQAKPFLPKEFVIPDIMKGGRKLQVQVPPFFADEERVLASNVGVARVNHNSHQAQNFKDQCQKIVAANGLCLVSQWRSRCPFIVEWEIQAYSNDLGTLTDDWAGEQFLAEFSIVARKLRTKRKTTGGFRVVGAVPGVDE